MIGSKRKKPVQVIRRGQLSKFGNIDYEIKLECGHVVHKTLKAHVDPLRKPYYLCWRCSEEYRKTI